MQYKEWCDAMDDEIVALEKNQIWYLVELSEGKEVVVLKWIYKIKFKSDGSILKFKARIVAKGYMQ